MNIGERQKRVLKIVGIVVISLLIISLGLVYWIISDHISEPKIYVNKEKRSLTKSTFFIRDIVRFPAKANVTPSNASDKILRVGIDSGTDILNFGRIYANMPVRKFVDIRNNEDRDVKICIKKYGSIAPYINSSADSFIMKSNEYRKIQISFTGKEIGYYEGEVDVIIKKPRYKIITPLLNWVGC